MEEGSALTPSRSPPHERPLGPVIKERPRGTHRRPFRCLCYVRVDQIYSGGGLVCRYSGSAFSRSEHTMRLVGLQSLWFCVLSFRAHDETAAPRVRYVAVVARLYTSGIQSLEDTRSPTTTSQMDGTHALFQQLHRLPRGHLIAEEEGGGVCIPTQTGLQQAKVNPDARRSGQRGTSRTGRISTGNVCFGRDSCHVK